MATNWKLAWAAALKAKRTWDRLPPEQRAKLLDSTTRVVKVHGPVVARKASATARKHGPALAEKTSTAAAKAADSARTQAPELAKRLAEAFERARSSRKR
jgi:acyl-CoA reductase-like NAD-dependent aldehyde dehydrogenase